MTWFRRELRLALALVLTLLAARPDVSAAPDTRTVLDSAGRKVDVPARVERVYAAGVPASVLVYTLAPEKLLGWPRAPRDEERAFLGRYADLPVLGRLTGRENTANVEVVLRARPDLILDYGATTATYASLADRIQKQSGIPYVLLNGDLSGIPDAYRLLGDILGVSQRGQELAAYAERLLSDVDRRVARVAPDRRPRVYYARGPRGLETALRGSINVETLDRLGARNVAGERPTGGGLATVSMEQVLGWNPEVIVTIDADFAAAVRSDPLWQSVAAVRAGRVYLAPLIPFAWIDFPPSVNRLVGLPWLGRILYPDVFREDLRAGTRDFYARFYHRAPDDAQVTALLEAGRPTK